MCLKEIGNHLQILLPIPHLIVNTIERTRVFNKGINTRTLLRAMPKFEGGLKLHSIYINAMHVLLCKLRQ